MNLGLGLGLGFTRSPGGVWAPTSLSNLKAWYRADLGVTVATGVSAWLDQSGTGDAGKNLAQASGAAQPTLTASDAAFNGHPTITSSAAQWLKSGTWATPLAQPYTVLAVASAVHGAGVSDGQTTDSALLYSRGATWSLYNGGLIDSGVDSAAPAIVVGVLNGASSKIYVASDSPTATGDTTSGGLGNSLTLLNDGSHTLGGATIAEFILVGGAISAQDFTAFRTYAKARYGLT